MLIPPEFSRCFSEILGFFHGFVLDFLLVFVFWHPGMCIWYLGLCILIIETVLTICGFRSEMFGFLPKMF